jgi:hypothetical protein
LTDKEWKEEVERVVASAGVPWVFRAGWIERRNEMLCAELIDKRSGTERTIRLSSQQFATPPARRVEIVRQLQK